MTMVGSRADRNIILEDGLRSSQSEFVRSVDLGTEGTKNIRTVGRNETQVGEIPRLELGRILQEVEPRPRSDWFVSTTQAKPAVAKVMSGPHPLREPTSPRQDYPGNVQLQ